MIFWFVYINIVCLSTILIYFRAQSLKYQLSVVLGYSALLLFGYQYFYGVLLLSKYNIAFFLMSLIHYCIHTKSFQDINTNPWYSIAEKLWHSVDCLMCYLYFGYPIFALKAVMLIIVPNEHYRYIIGSVGFYLTMVLKYYELNNRWLNYEMLPFLLVYLYVVSYHYRKHLGFKVDSKYDHIRFIKNPPGLAFMFRSLMF